MKNRSYRSSRGLFNEHPRELTKVGISPCQVCYVGKLTGVRHLVLDNLA